MSRRSLGVALILSLALNLSTIAAAVYFRWGPGLRPAEHGGPAQAGSVGEQLRLTQAQQEQVRAIHRQFMQQVAPLRTQIRAANADLAQAAISGEADPTETARLLDQSAALHRELQQQAARYLGREARVLSAEQREKLAQTLSAYIGSGACRPGGGAGMGLGVLGGHAPRDP